MKNNIRPIVLPICMFTICVCLGLWLCTSRCWSSTLTANEILKGLFSNDANQRLDSYSKIDDHFHQLRYPNLKNKTINKLNVGDAAKAILQYHKQYSDIKEEDFLRTIQLINDPAIMDYFLGIFKEGWKGDKQFIRQWCLLDAVPSSEKEYFTKQQLAIGYFAMTGHKEMVVPLVNKLIQQPYLAAPIVDALTKLNQRQVIPLIKDIEPSSNDNLVIAKVAFLKSFFGVDYEKNRDVMLKIFLNRPEGNYYSDKMVCEYWERIFTNLIDDVKYLSAKKNDKKSERAIVEIAQYADGGHAEMIWDED